MSFGSYGWKWDKYRDDWEEYYSTVINNKNGYDLRLIPFYYLYSGHVDFGSLSTVGAGSYYWSSTAVSSSNIYHLYFTSANVYSSNSNSRIYGFPIRCLAR